MQTVEKMAHEGYQTLCRLISGAQLTEKNYQSGEFLLRQGEAITSLYWITLGEYSMHYTADNGKTFSLGQRFVSHCIIGELEYLTHTPCQFSVVACEEMTVKIIPLSLMNQILVTHAPVGIWLSQLLSRSYQNCMSRTMERFLQPLVFNIAADMYERYSQHRPLTDFPQIIREAERFGCSERAYRRAITQLTEEKLIRKDADSYQITDPEAFRIRFGKTELTANRFS